MLHRWHRYRLPENTARRYLHCAKCGCCGPPRVEWRTAHLMGRCTVCLAWRRLPASQPWLELAARADHDILLAFHERRPSPPAA